MFLANALKLQTKVSAGINLLDITGLQVWLKNDTDITFDGNGVSEWQDQTSNNNHAVQSRDGNKPAYNAGRVVFDGSDDTLLLSSEVNLGAFTIILACDLDEAGTLSNDGALGRAGNDVLKLYRGSDDERIGLRANGVNYEINPMSTAYPTTKFLLTCTRNAISGLWSTRINGTQVGAVATTITDLFDVTQIGSGDISNTQYSGDLNEVAIWNVELTGSDLTNAEADITSRNGI